MLKKVLLAGLLAGLAAGLALAVLQHFTTVPLIIAAEAYEGAEAGAPSAHDHAASGAAHDHAATPSAHDHAAGGHDHGAGSWSPADGLERTLATSAATIVSAIGFALVLIAVLLVAGEEITPATALGYAAAGFASTGLATALGLAPELPGSAAADLDARQLWWFATALSTAAGLFLLLRTGAARRAIAWPLGLLLIVAPHAVGAPHPEGYASLAPAELAAHFAASSLVVHAALWVMVGASVGFVWPRLKA